MKRALIITCMLFVVLIACTAAVGAVLHRTAEEVNYQETVIYGNIAALQGTEVQTQVNLDDLLFWRTTFRPGVADSKTVTFKAEQYAHATATRAMEYGATVSTSYSIGYNDISAEEVTGLRRAFNEMMQETKPGQSITRTIRLIDYCEYYPLQINLHFPGYYTQWDSQDPVYHANVDNYQRQEEYHADLLAIRDFFRIPVLPEDTMEIHLSVSADSNSISWGSSRGNNGADYFPMDTVSVTTENTAYMTFSAKSNLGKTVDTSLIPGGYGIYALPFRVEGSVAHLETDGLKMVFPMDPEATFVSLDCTKDEKQLLLFTLEGRHPALTVIDIATMREVQKLVLTELTPETGFYPLHIGEDFLVLQLDGKQLTLLTVSEDGLYSHRFTVNILPEELGETSYALTRHTSFYYDGTRLITARNKVNGLVLCDLRLTAYDETGVLCVADYTCTVNLGLDNKNFQGFCEPYGNPLTVVRFTQE